MSRGFKKVKPIKKKKPRGKFGIPVIMGTDGGIPSGDIHIHMGYDSGSGTSSIGISDEAGHFDFRSDGTGAGKGVRWRGTDPIVSPVTEVEKIEIDNNNKYYNNEKTISMRKMEGVLEKVYSNPSLRKSIVPLYIGNPGLGKTVIIQEFAKKKKANLVELITSQMSPFEISGIAMPDKETKKMTYYNFDKLENLADGDILFFDELLNGNPVVLNACLTILEQRKFISGRPLPDIMIVAAANPQGMTPLTPQIKERFIWYTTEYDELMWIDYMQKKFFIPLDIAKNLSELIKNEEFISNNFNTPRSLDKAVNMLIHEVETPYSEVVLPLLQVPIQNPFAEEVSLPGNKKLAPDEMITWLELIQLKLKIKK